LRQGALDGLNDSSEEQQFSPSPQRSARGSRRSLRPSASDDALDSMSGQDASKRTVALEVQVESLSSHSPSQPNLASDAFIAPAPISQRYRDFLTWARKLNHAYTPLELVLLGAHGAGKSALVDALTGFPISPIGVTTKRPIHFHLLDDPSAQAAKFSVRDSSGDFTCLLPEQAANEIRKRNKRSLEPVFVQIEFAWGFELTIVDTPAARSPEDISIWASSPSSAERIFLCVECCPNDKQHKPNTRVTDTLSILPIIRRIDPAMSNTFCVLTRFDDFLDSFCGEPSVVEAAVNAVSGQPILFATLPSDEIRTAAYAHKDSDTFFKTKIWQYDARDAHSLSRWFDLAATPAFLSKHQGIVCLRNLIFRAFERHLNALVPELSQAFADHDAALKEQLNSLKRIRSRWNVENIRSSACEYATLYLRLLDDLVGGSSIGQPHSRGQTLKEEELETGLSWAAAVSGLDSPLSPPQTSRSNAQSALRLYGAPQLFRLLDDFRAFALKLEMPSVADSELSITSVDPAWTASEIARSKVEQQFVPLMHQLLDRSFQVLKRTATVADAVADELVLSGAVKAQANAVPKASSRRVGRSLSRIPSTLSASVLAAELETNVKTASSVIAHLRTQPRRDSRLEPLTSNNADTPLQEVSVQDFDLLQEHTAASQVAILTSKVTQREFPAFSSFLKQSFLFGLTTLQRKCMQRCEDEFYGAHTLYWELTGGVDPLALAGMAISERQSSVKKLVLKLYAEIKSRLIDGFVRNVQTYFLNQSSYLDLMKTVLSEVSTLPNESVVDMFKLNAITSALDRRIASIDRKCTSLALAQSKFSNLIK
jgi:hypothetical protein